MRPGAVGAAAALLWALLCLRWFDVGRGFRPAWLDAVPPAVLAVAGALAAGLWARARWGFLRGPSSGGPRGGLLLVAGLALFFRLPLAWHGAAGYTTPDGALSGIVALHARDGSARHVFVPHVPYSGSLKSHLTAPLAAVVDPARAFALVSVAFYVWFAVGTSRLGRMVGGGRVGLGAGVYVAFAPAFVTHYSLSNDGNYVEVLALGTWAVVLAVRWWHEPAARPTLALAAGLLLGLGFWCHILAAIHAVVVGLVLLAAGRRALASWPVLAAGFGLGALPSLLWNAAHGWQSFAYLTPGGTRVGAAQEPAGLLDRVGLALVDHAPVLMGYDVGYGPGLDLALMLASWLAVACVALAVLRAVRLSWVEAAAARRVLLVFAATNLAVALLALPHVPGNPRYLLFLTAPIAVFLADALSAGRRRLVFAGIVAFGALGSLGQAPAALPSDRQWRAFVAELEALGVRHCHTDFFLATKVNFLSEERVVCSAKLGPVTTEYFFEYRERVEAAAEAALIAVNTSAADKLERRLERLGVAWERRNLMKPVLLRLSRKVDPQELFPDRSFPWR